MNFAKIVLKRYSSTLNQITNEVLFTRYCGDKLYRHIENHKKTILLEYHDSKFQQLFFVKSYWGKNMRFEIELSTDTFCIIKYG